MGGVHIEARDLVLKYGETAALDGLSVTARAGRVLAVVGPSGAGKSTLLQIVAGLTRPDAGDVLFDGASILDRPPEKRDLGVVFQSYALFPHLTVEDNVAFGLVVRGVKRREARRRVAPVLERLEIVMRGHAYRDHRAASMTMSHRSSPGPKPSGVTWIVRNPIRS